MRIIRWKKAARNLAATVAVAVAAVGITSPAVAEDGEPVAYLARQTKTEIDFADDVFDLINESRADAGVSPLQRVAALDAIAHSWSVHQARHGAGANPDYLAQYPAGWTAHAELTTSGQRHPRNVHRAWYLWQPDREVLLDPSLEHVGVGISFDEDTASVHATVNLATLPARKATIGERPATPVMNDREGTKDDSFVIPSVTPGVSYWKDGQRLNPGIHPASGYVEIVALIAPGYHFDYPSDRTARAWRMRFTDSVSPAPNPAPDPEPTPTPSPAPDEPAQRPSPTNIPNDDGSSTAHIDDGGVGGSGNMYFLNDKFSPYANIVFDYANAGGRVYVGDWDGDGRDTLAYRIGSTFYVRNSNSAGGADQIFSYGRPGDRVYVGDWDGDGRDTFAVRRGKTYHVKNALAGGDADHVIHYGRAGDDVLVGDWDGDGEDTLAVRRGKTYHVKNRIAGGEADTVVKYGRAQDHVAVGDWDGDGHDSFAVRRGNTYFIANEVRAGDADYTLQYGRSGDTTLVGDWNGDGRDTLGVRRPHTPST